MLYYNSKKKMYGGMYMSISYNKLWKQLIDLKMTKTQLRLQADLGTATLAKLSKDQQVSMDGRKCINGRRNLSAKRIYQCSNLYATTCIRYCNSYQKEEILS